MEKSSNSEFKFTMARFGYVVAIVFQLVFMYVAHHITSWDLEILSFIRGDFNNILWAIDLSLEVGIVANFVRIFVDAKPVRSILQILESIVTIGVSFIILVQFPYDFRLLLNISWINTAVKILIWIGIFGSTISIITELVKIIKHNYKD